VHSHSNATNIYLACIYAEKNTDSFEPGGTNKLTKLMRHHFELQSAATDDILYSGFKLAKAMAKSENSKGIDYTFFLKIR
jgi:hypothetical protein